MTGNNDSVAAIDTQLTQPCRDRLRLFEQLRIIELAPFAVTPITYCDSAGILFGDAFKETGNRSAHTAVLLRLIITAGNTSTAL